jgi:hypothetical protein
VGACIHGRRDHAQLAFDPLAGRRRDDGRRSGRDPRQVGGADFCAPFEAPAANQAKQLLSRLHGGADGRAARRDDAGVRRQDLGLGLAQAGGVLARLCCLDPRLRGFGSGLCLRQLLRAVKALLAQLPGALQAGPGLGQRRLGLGDTGAGLGKFTVDGFRRNARQYLAARDHVADAGADLDDPMVCNLRADDRLLPGGDIAARGEGLGPIQGLRLDGTHAQCRLRRRRCLGVAGRLATGGEQRQQRQECEFPLHAAAPEMPFSTRSRCVCR